MARDRGFTLLEVLVALAVLSLAMVALVRALGQQAQAFAHTRDVGFAQWVAADVIAETRLQETLPAMGRREGRASQAGRQWRWELRIQGTPEPRIRRLDVDVFRDGDSEPLLSLSGFATPR